MEEKPKKLDPASRMMNRAFEIGAHGNTNSGYPVVALSFIVAACTMVYAFIVLPVRFCLRLFRQ